MADIAPFHALRYDERVAGPLGTLISPPYDVVSSEQRAALRAANERSFVSVELPDATPAGHANASDLLRRWEREGALRREPAPAVYVDEHTFRLGGQTVTRTEVLVALRLYELTAGVVLPHERTFPKAKAERLELLRATRANTSPVFGMFADDQGAIAALRAAPAAATVSAEVGEESHRLSVITDTAAIGGLRRALAGARVYIADGHHRYETALGYANERGASVDSPERYVLTALCALDDPGLRILGTHRVVHGGGATLDAAVARSFDATALAIGAGDARGIDDTLREGSGIVLAGGGRFLRLEPRADADLAALPAAWRRLPVAVTDELLLGGARESGADVTYEHDTARAIAAAAGGATAILLRAVDPLTLRAVADAGERLPQKTTYFYPKVPAGLVIRSLDLA